MTIAVSCRFDSLPLSLALNALFSIVITAILGYFDSIYEFNSILNGQDLL